MTKPKRYKRYSPEFKREALIQVTCDPDIRTFQLIDSSAESSFVSIW